MKKKEKKAWSKSKLKSKKSVMLKVRREKNFPIFFLIFLFRMTQFAKKANFFCWKFWFFLSLRNVGDFALFAPWRENQSFFWHAKCYITLRRFYLEHFSKNVSRFFKKSPKKTFSTPFCPKKGGQNIFSKNRAPSLFSIYAPLTSCKKLERLLEPILRKVRYGRTN